VARISYDDETATAYQAVREVPRGGLSEWRDAVERHLHPSAGMTVVDIGAGTGAFAGAFRAWFGVEIVAVEPSDAMRARIPELPGIRALAGEAAALPLPDGSADAVWISNVLHHIPDLEAAAAEIRRVLLPGGPILIRAGMSGTGYAGVEVLDWFPEAARTIDTFPSVEAVCAAFAAAGFRREALAKVREAFPLRLSVLLEQIDAFRQAETPLRGLTDAEFRRGKERIRAAVDAGEPDERWNHLDLLVLR
jgi:ubiquinone/menaquinone biosynthesis C-methylase UbiE